MNSFNISILQCGNVAIASRVAGALKYGAELKDVLVCSGIGSRLAVTRLIEMLKTPVEAQKLEEDEDEAILRRTVVGVLKQIGDASVLPVLKDVAQAGHEHESVRVMAQSAIEQLGKNGIRNE